MSGKDNSGKTNTRSVADFAFAAVLLAEAVCLFCADFGASISETAARVSAALDIVMALGFAANLRSSNFLVFKAFAFAGFFLYVYYSVNGGYSFAAAAAFSALLGVTAKVNFHKS